MAPVCRQWLWKASVHRVQLDQCNNWRITSCGPEWREADGCVESRWTLTHLVFICLGFPLTQAVDSVSGNWPVCCKLTCFLQVDLFCGKLTCFLQVDLFSGNWPVFCKLTCFGVIDLFCGNWPIFCCWKNCSVFSDARRISERLRWADGPCLCFLKGFGWKVLRYKDLWNVCVENLSWTAHSHTGLGDFDPFS